MDSRHCSDLQFESNSCIHLNSQAHGIFHLLPMGLIKNPTTSRIVCKPVIVWQFLSGCYSLIRPKVDIPFHFRLVNSGIKILVGAIRIGGVQLVDDCEICSMCRLVYDSIDGHCLSRQFYHWDLLMGRYRCWMPVRWSFLDLQQAVKHRFQSLEWIQLPFFTDNVR
jgi:hypothetical protein